jgi:ubiquinone/menaquinone biosynthesis C-methylase UbiE
MKTASEAPQPASYYQQVAAYYDFDSRNFEERAKQNAVLGRIRQEFRAVSDPYVSGNVLEIGCGPGLDLVYWAQRKPDAKIYGIDISPGMLEHAEANCHRARATNVQTGLGSVEDVEALFPGVRFDFVFCYFGALNTTRDLSQAAAALHRVLKPRGRAVLTFVNRWYLFEIFWNVLRGKPRRGVARLRPVWGGYATGRTLESRCYSPSDIRKAFGSRFVMEQTRGYSILYPAWYRHEKWVKRWPKFCEFLWRIDRLLNVTPCWRFGEYALYTLQARPAAPPTDQ